MGDTLGNLWGDDIPKAEAMRPLPEDPQAERAFLGTILAPGNGHMILESTSYMEPAYFSVPQYRMIYKAALECAQAGIDATAVSVRDQLGVLAPRAGETRLRGLHRFLAACRAIAGQSCLMPTCWTWRPLA